MLKKVSSFLLASLRRLNLSQNIRFASSFAPAAARKGVRRGAPDGREGVIETFLEDAGYDSARFFTRVKLL